MTVDSSDEDLLIKAQDGCPESAGALLVRHQILMYSIAFAVLHNEQDALDAVQVAATKAWDKLEKCEPGRISGWLKQITLRTAIDLLRNRRRKREREQSLERGESAEVNDDPAASLLTNERKLDFGRLLDRVSEYTSQLSPKRRAAFELRLAGLSNREIAERLQISIGATEVRLCRATTAIKGQFGDEAARLLEGRE